MTAGGVEPLNTRYAPATVPRIMALTDLYFTLRRYTIISNCQPFFQKNVIFLKFEGRNHQVWEDYKMEHYSIIICLIIQIL